ncbi:MAG: hypothetical protein ACI83W_001552 [Marinoscillum sp.]|jgi:hypothetical protein
MMQTVKVEIRKGDVGFSLFRGGKPYVIKGAGLEFGSMDTLVSHGGNSIRNWRTENASEKLDEAQSLGITISLCLELGSERHGFDYNDKQAVQDQFEKLREEVIKFKDHPALLSWIIGNELNLDFSNSKVYEAVNDISRMIHELDPNHPTTTTVAGLNKELVEIINSLAPDLDYLGVQLYGEIQLLPKLIKDTGWVKPFMVTEWGATGYWEVPLTKWGAPIEENSTVKGKNFYERYQQGIAPLKGQCLGSYVFLWGQKQERTPTWFGMFLSTGEVTACVDAMYTLWNDESPKIASPILQAIYLDAKSALDNIRLKSGMEYNALAEVSVRDREILKYFWEVKEETTDIKSGGDREEVPPTIEVMIADINNHSIKLRAPKTPGAYRLFFYAYDQRGHAAHANIPFYVDAQ